MLSKRIVFGIEFNSRSTRPEWKIGLTAGWIDYRMNVFMTYTMKSLKKQTNQDFVALIQYADRTEHLIKQELSKYEPLPENIQFVPASKYQENILNLITGFDRLYLVRLDCDDMYHNSFVQQLMDYRPKSNTQALINRRGYVYDAIRQRFAAINQQSPPFYTLIYKVDEYVNGKRYSTPGGHRAVIKLKYESLTRKGNRNYMIVVHKRNTLNQNLLRKAIFKTNRARLERIIGNFFKEDKAELEPRLHQPLKTLATPISTELPGSPEPELQEMMETTESTAAGAQITKHQLKGVSIITATNKPEYMKQLFMNYSRQNWKTKELIILLNNDRMSIESYRKYAKHFGQVSVYRLPEKSPLGKCLNYGISKAKYEIIAKFDDDDFYSPHYLSEAMAEFERTGANIIGKNKFYMYFLSSSKLMHASMPARRLVAGATIMFEKRIYPGVVFSNLRKGSDMRFLHDCMKKGYKVGSTSKYNFTCIRRGNQTKHTWKVTARTFRILRAKTVARTSRFREMVSRAVPND